MQTNNKILDFERKIVFFHPNLMFKLFPKSIIKSIFKKKVH